MHIVPRIRRLPFLLCCCIAATCGAAEDAAPKAKPVDKERPASPSPLIDISPETTRVSGPIAADGYIDYLGALRKACKTGVAPDRNVVVSLWQAMGPFGELEDVPWQKEYFRDMGIEPLPAKGDYYVSIRQIAQMHLGKEAAAGDVQDLTNKLWDNYSERTQGPWDEMDDPLLARWIESNEKPMSVAVAGIMTRDQYYAPLLAGDDDFSGMLVAILLPTAQQTREFARFLAARAMYRVAKDDVDGAMKDLLACHRLARHYSRAPTLVEALVCYAIDGVASAGDFNLSHHAKLTAKQARWYQDQLNKMPPPPSTADCIDISERYMYLDCAVMLARKGPGGLKELGGMAGVRDEAGGAFAFFGKLLRRAAIDWNEPLKMGNDLYDRMAVAARLPTYKERMAAGNKIEEELKQLAVSARDVSGLAASFFSLRSMRSEVGRKIGAVLCSLIMPAISAASHAEDRTLMNNELSQVAVALSAHRNEKGKYPDKLAELVPDFIKAIPADRYSCEGLIYKRGRSGYLLYSVGRNLQDDGGSDIASKNPDVSVRSPEYPRDSE